MAFTDLHTIREWFEGYTSHEQVHAGNVWKQAGRGVKARETASRDWFIPETAAQETHKRRKAREARLKLRAAPLPRAAVCCCDECLTQLREALVVARKFREREAA